MKEGTLGRAVFAAAVSGACALAAVAVPGTAHAAPAPAYNAVVAAPYGGEPSIASDNNGVIYVDSPSLGLQVFDSTNHGTSFAPMGTDPDPNSGDNCLATDQSNALWQCNLNGSPSTGPLQAD